MSDSQQQDLDSGFAELSFTYSSPIDHWPDDNNREHLDDLVVALRRLVEQMWALGYVTGRLISARPSTDSPYRFAGAYRYDTGYGDALLVDQLEPATALRNRDFLELLVRSSIPATGLHAIARALDAEPAPPADPTVVALLDTAGETAVLGYYTSTRIAHRPTDPAP